jgi:aspartate 1-decarboxylase
MIDIVMYREWHRSVHTVNGAAAGVHKVPDLVVAAAFQNMSKAHNVAVDVGVGIV